MPACLGAVCCAFFHSQSAVLPGAEAGPDNAVLRLLSFAAEYGQELVQPVVDFCKWLREAEPPLQPNLAQQVRPQLVPHLFVFD